METIFRVFKLVNPDSVIGYKHIGVSENSDKIIHINEEHIDIGEIYEKDQLTYEDDYAPTESTFTFDLEFMDELIDVFVGHKDYSLVAYYDMHKHIVIAAGRNSEYSEWTVTTHSELREEREIAKVIYDLLEKVQKAMKNIK